MLRTKSQHSKNVQYRVSDVHSPPLGGPQLKLFVGIVEKSRTARKGVLALNNMHVLQEKTYAEAPALWPFPPPESFTIEREKQQDLPTSPDAELLRPSPCKGLNGAKEFLNRYQSGELSPSEVAAKVLDQIKLSNKGPQPLNAVIEVDEEGLTQAAAQSSRRHREGRPLSVLDGVPIAVKSEIVVERLHSKAGTSFLTMPANHPEATIVARLRQAGALIVGLTNMHEIGIGVTGANRTYGVARNPYDLARHTGGSSSGSAAAVAAGLVPIAVGADGGGSIRIPSSLCGIVGLKPTFARMSGHGSHPSCISLCQPGPMASNVMDCALAFRVMAGSDPLDERTMIQPPPSLRGLGHDQDFSGWTAGIYSSWFEHADPEVVAVCSDLLLSFQKRGLRLMEIDIPELEEVRIAHFATIAAEMHAYMKPHLPQHRADLAATTRFALSLGQSITADDYLQAQRVRRRAMRSLDDIFRKVDFIVSPASAVVAPIIKQGADDVLDTTLMGRLMRFSQLYNLTGNPGICFPAGYTDQGLPVGIQFGGRWWAEADLLRVAAVAETMVPRVLPPNFWPALS